MKVSREQAAENRNRIVTVAGHLLREHGVDGIGVDAIMKAAGLTHGGFYKNFGSKDALVAEACERVMAENAAKSAASNDAGAEQNLGRWVSSYLSMSHSKAIGDGCIFAALATDAGRGSTSLRRIFSSGLTGTIERLSRLMPGQPAKRRRRALATMAGLVGAIVLARATDDETMRAELLSATATMLLDQPIE